MATVLNLKTFARRGLFRNILLLIPGIAGYLLVHEGLVKTDLLKSILGRIDVIYMVIIICMICNSLMMVFLDIYSRTDKSRVRPLKGVVQAVQVLLICVGLIISVAVLIDKSPKALLTGLGASAAVLMLIFKDSILGFVAGIQLMQNNMIRIGDWIQTTDGSANGTVMEMTLNTVKVRNWDNTITTIPPYSLVSLPFKNWRGMQESAGRRVDKMLYLDIRSITINGEGPDAVTNSQSYRYYIEQYLRSHPKVAKNLDLIVAQRQQSQYGLPIEIYFFITDKVWDQFENIQSDIFDHLIAKASDFGLKLYQFPMEVVYKQEDNVS